MIDPPQCRRALGLASLGRRTRTGLSPGPGFSLPGAMRYVRIRSWHRVKFTGRAGQVFTRCGRMAASTSPQTEEIPTNEASCETCLRLAANDET